MSTQPITIRIDEQIAQLLVISAEMHRLKDLFEGWMTEAHPANCGLIQFHKTSTNLQGPPYALARALGGTWERQDSAWHGTHTLLEPYEVVLHQAEPDQAAPTAIVL